MEHLFLSKEQLLNCMEKLGYIINFEDISVFFENYDIFLQEPIINQILNMKIPKSWFSSPQWFKVGVSIKAFLKPLETKYGKLKIFEHNTLFFEKENVVLNREKQIIVTRFYTHVKNIDICVEGNKKHCGIEGHWLEKKMGIKHNSNNEPDIYG
jgi:hypothetical protein